MENADKYHRVVREFMHAGILHRKLCDAMMCNTGVYRGQHHLLMEIHRNQNISQKDLAEKLEISSATVAVSIKKLEKGGYIEKGMNPEDNRCNRIQLTQKGEDVVKKSFLIFQEIDDAMMNNFTEDELLLFEHCLIKIQKNFSNALSEKEIIVEK